MTFEEFFKKKKIDLVTFEQGEPALFSEFKIHYEQMGEKSFDHTKKYWFNKLRLRFPASPEVKVEKVAIENTLAEQTITETLIETTPPPSNIGFKPKFKAGLTKPAEIASQPKEDTEQASPPPNIGFKPKFRAGITTPAEPKPDIEPTPATDKPAENTEQATPPASLGFKPKFKAEVTKTSAAPVPEKKEEPKADETTATDQPAEDDEAKPAYKPRFNVKNIKPKSEE
ncbi:MAG: hypothetical protein JWR54_2262 [Mucilaginibacter sp.]|nr:hypothetical protein [Mucilaginibacter sp.]